MMSEAPTVALGDELFDVQQRFIETQLDALPVMENGRFLGLITSRDVAEVYRLISIEPSLLPKLKARIEQPIVER
jgi:CBS domain-containing protein